MDLPLLLLLDMFCQLRFYAHAKILEYLSENSSHRCASKVHFQGQEFLATIFKLTPPDRNNIITGILEFLQPHLSFLISLLQCFFSLTDRFVSIGHAETPMSKTPEVLDNFISLCTVPINFHITDPAR